MSQTNNALLLSRLLIILSIILLTTTSTAAASNTNEDNTPEELVGRQLLTNSSSSRQLQTQTIPTLKSLSTPTTSTKSTAGFLFNIRATRSPLILYGLGLNFVNSIYIKPTPPPPSGSDGPLGMNFGYNEGRYAKGRRFRIVVYTKVGTFEGYENSREEWKVWFNTTVVSGKVVICSVC